LGAAGPAGVGDCRRSQAWQRPGLGAKRRGDRGGSIPTLTLGQGGARGRLHRRRRTADSGGWGGSGGGAVECKEWCWGSGPSHVRVSGPLYKLEEFLVNTVSTRGSEQNNH
jgi:hypothetical protein